MDLALNLLNTAGVTSGRLLFPEAKEIDAEPHG